ncbi:autotransporter outer membrane beta-barrel domain-containing protein [Enterobacter bugandensis]|uniref:autotransporter outer membrane beta-barrel domain-containing protein n=1 Tax=Enterobacter bugandensis TaxID=881260 RepID=UPI0023B123F6|nr:autotransporter outer membrane beta-barrel domain-containing protein [Enterobacter bugandensis]MDE7590822.1 autotransporter outer membrane beta-barrel domain-containing protein [Enterobacter bugandensis]
MTTLGKISFISACIFLALSTARESHAACDNYAPDTGETVECDISAPNPAISPIASITGATDVTVNIAAGSELSVAGMTAILLGDGSNIMNAGRVTGSTGIRLQEGSSVLNNSGAITGTTGPGVEFNGSGNNQLINSGTIQSSGSGNTVVFGSGNDSFIMNAGTITGDVDTGDGGDSAWIRGGTITGTLLQGNGIDDFVMSGGSLGALQQGDNRDTFLMTGGTIVGAFEDGDVAKMTGGTIGRVNMKLDNNIFDMSGGDIVGNLVTGFGNDTILVSGNSVIGGNISVSGGVDSVTVTGGTIKGEIRMSAGDDLLHWEKGTILGSILMEADNDRIELTNLDATSAASSPLIDGGAGDDILVMDNSVYTHSAANVLQGIEHITLNNGSTLTLNNSSLPLGDARDDNAGTGYIIDSTSTLAIQHESPVAFNSHVSGTGTIRSDTGGNAFSFTSNNAGDNFAGIMALGDSAFALDGVNTQALGQATLLAGTDSVTTVGAGEQRIGGLMFAGGIVDFGHVAPGNTLADNTIQITRDLNLNGSGTVIVGVDNMVNEYPSALDHLPLLSQDDANTFIKLAGSDGSVTGNGGSLTLRDASGKVITSGVTRDIIQNGKDVAQGTWDWRLSSGENQDGLYIAWALKQVEIMGTGADALVLNGQSASGNAADLSAKITGSGDLAFENAANSMVSLSNQSNDYTGITDVRSGRLQMNNDNVLGNTALLQMASDTAFNMNGFTQTIGSVDAAESTQINIAGGSLTIDQGGAIKGNLLGAGDLRVKSGMLAIHGANADLSAGTQIMNAATVNLNNANGLGSGNIENAGRLKLNGARGILINSLSSSGEVDLNASEITLAGDNSRFSGAFNIDADSQLMVEEAQHLGGATVRDAGTLNLTNDHDWTLSNSVTGAGNLVKNGGGVVTLTLASAAYTGSTRINQGGVTFGSRSQPVTMATSEVNVSNGFLAGNGEIAGNVINSSLLQVGSDMVIQNSTAQRITSLTRVQAFDSLTIGGNLTNSGLIQLGQSRDTVTAGNVLTILGNYAGNSGQIAFHTVLGNDASVTDHMIINGDTSGTTYVRVANAGGRGASTRNGIELISVGGNSAGEFVQDGRIVAGAYDYRLSRGNGNSEKNWYLTNNADEPSEPSNPSEPSIPVPPEGNNVMFRPEASSYTANLASANNMFVTRLHDRLGETQYTDILTGENKVTSLWLRQAGTHNTSRSHIGSQKTTSNQYVVMLGGEVAQWSSDGLDRSHLGIMGGYGNNRSNTRSNMTGYNSRGQVYGYSVGLYGTWYANDADKTGLYIDSWAQYGWFRNTVNGKDLPQEKYDSDGLSASLESGYTWKIGDFDGGNNETGSVYIQPQAQITWMGVKSDDHTEANGTRISSDGQGNIQTRLGTRIFIKGHSKTDDGKDREFEPFIEANWLHNTHSYSTRMDSVRITQAGTRNIGELKIGVEGQLSRNLTAWSNVGQQLGDKGYSTTEAMLGIKYSW